NSKNYLRLPSSGRREGQHARLLSPRLHQPRCAFCLAFRYRASGTSGATLRVLRNSSQENRLLWKIREEPGSEWKDGRVHLMSYDGDYQVVIEGIVGKGQSGEIAVDDIRIANDIPLENCMEPISAFPKPTVYPGGTLLPGSEPTVDTVSVQPIPVYWYYVMAAGGAVLVLVSVALALVLHYHRFRYAAKKSDPAITYKTSHYANGAPMAVEPTLTIKLEQDDPDHSSRC
ncbi:neuropilin-2-like, partial [Rhinoderma darwinii]